MTSDTGPQVSTDTRDAWSAGEVARLEAAMLRQAREIAVLTAKLKAERTRSGLPGATTDEVERLRRVNFDLQRTVSGQNEMLRSVLAGIVEVVLDDDVRLSLIRATRLVDPDWYLATHTDVAAAGMDAILHFARYGISDGRVPNGFLAAGN